MARPHSRDLSRWLRSWGSQDPYDVPPLDQVIQPTVIVDDLSHLAPPIRLPTFACVAYEPAVASKYGVIQFFPPPEGAIVQVSNLGADTHVALIGLSLGDVIDNSKDTLSAGVAIDGPQRATLEHGTSDTDLDTVLTSLGTGLQMLRDYFGTGGPWYVPGGYALYVHNSVAQKIIHANVEWIEFPQAPTITR